MTHAISDYIEWTLERDIGPNGEEGWAEDVEIGFTMILGTPEYIPSHAHPELYDPGSPNEFEMLVATSPIHGVIALSTAEESAIIEYLQANYIPD